MSHTLRRPVPGWRTLSVLVALLVLSLAAARAALSPGPAIAQAPDPTDQCKHGGFATFLDPSTGQPFRNQGQCVSFVNHGGTLVPIPTTPTITTYTSAAAFSAAVGPQTTIDFENQPRDASSCPQPPQPALLTNPLTINGVMFASPGCLTTGFLGQTGDNLLCLRTGGTITFPAGTKGALLNVNGIGTDSVTLRFATPAPTTSADVTVQGIPFVPVPAGASSPAGIATATVVAATNNIACFSSVQFATTLT
jgi:hypothetical protein